MTELEDELKKTKDDLEKQKEISKTQHPEDVCTSHVFSFIKWI